MRKLFLLILIMLPITFSCDKEQVRIDLLNISELGGSSLVSPSGGTFELHFDVSGSWTIENSSDWISVSPQSGAAGSATVTLTSSENTTGKSRHTDIIIRSGEQMQRVSISQSSGSVSLSPSKIEVPMDGNTTEVSVKCDGGELSVTFSDPEDSSWILVEEVSEEVYTVTVSKNDSGKRRSSEVSFSSGFSEAVLSISQEGAQLQIPSSELVAGCAGGLMAMDLMANVAFSVEDLPEWMSLDESIEEEGRIYFNVSENPAGEERSATFHITSDYFQPQAVQVRQEANTDNMLDWAREDFDRHSLIIKFTGTWCSYCPQMSDAIHDAIEKSSDKIMTFSAYDNMSHTSLSYYGYPKLSDNYPIGTSLPQAVIDSRAVLDISGGVDKISQAFQDISEETRRLPALCRAESSAVVEGDNVKVDLSVYAKVGGTYRISVLLLEDGIVAEQAGVSSGYVHDNVIKDSFTDVNGDELVFATGGVKDLHYELQIPRTVKNVDNCRLLVVFYRTGYLNVTEVKDIQTLVENGLVVDNVQTMPLE